MPVEDITSLIKRLSPLMEADSEIFRELAVFFGDSSQIQTHTDDLSKFLGRKRLYRVLRLSGESYKDCVYQLVDERAEKPLQCVRKAQQKPFWLHRRLLHHLKNQANIFLIT